MRCTHLLRWWGPLAGAMLVAMGSALAGQFYYHSIQGGNPGLFALALHFPILFQFAKGWFLSEILPLYILLGLLGWTLTAVLAPFLVGGEWRRQWTGSRALAGTLGGFLLLHAWLWWKVPATLWVIPGLRVLPLGLSLGLIPLAGFLLLRTALPRGYVGYGAAALLCLLWIGLAQTPFWIEDWQSRRTRRDGHSAELLVLAIDGFRSDVAYSQGLGRFRGLHAEHAYTPIPATRMVYGLLWGGDPLRFTSGHIMPDIEEYEGKVPYHILEEAKAKGKKVRFFIDDGGTIGLLGRGEEFDLVKMPSRGWENFINSNLSVHFPVYASWLDVLRVFPTTNPWAAPDNGLHRALEEGRGGDWVFFHACLIHQPIYLTRSEFSEIPGWWWMPAQKLEPFHSLQEMSEEKIQSWDERASPALAYQIRAKTLLNSWASVWNGLNQDPTYGKATRIFFSDHGEQFPHVSEKIQLDGHHGFDLNPWELKMPLVVDGPGRQSGKFTPPVSLMGLRSALHDLVTEQQPPTLEAMSKVPVVCRKNLMLSPDMSPDTPFVTAEPLGIVKSTYIGPDGVWVMVYAKPADQRGEQAAVAALESDGLAVYRPLKKGGALRSVYKDYHWIEDKEVNEATYRARKAYVEKELRKLSLGN